MDNQEKTYIVPESILRQLIEHSFRYCALEDGGVDNWEGYSQSIKEYLNYSGYTYQEEMISDTLNHFEVLK